MTDQDPWKTSVKVGNRAKEGADLYLTSHPKCVGPLDAAPVASSSAVPMAGQTSAVNGSTSGDQDESRFMTGGSLADMTDVATLGSPKIEVVEVRLGNAPDIGFNVESSAPSNLPDPTYVKHETYKRKTTHSYPLRMAFRKDKTFEVAANHFEVTFDPETRFCECQVIGISFTERRAGKKRFMGTVIDQIQSSKTNQNSFATDSIDRIASWKPLFKLAPDQPTDWIKVRDGTRITDSKITYRGCVDTEGFCDYINSKHATGFDPEPTKNALNIIDPTGSPTRLQETKADYGIERGDADAVRACVLATFQPYYKASFRDKSVDG